MKIYKGGNIEASYYHLKSSDVFSVEIFERVYLLSDDIAALVNNFNGMFDIIKDCLKFGTEFTGGMAHIIFSLERIDNFFMFIFDSHYQLLNKFEIIRYPCRYTDDLVMHFIYDEFYHKYILMTNEEFKERIC